MVGCEVVVAGEKEEEGVLEVMSVILGPDMTVRDGV